jgi:hypothetical protein
MLLLRKARGSFKTTAAVYKLKTPSLKTKSPSKPSTSLSPLFDAKDSTPICFEIRSEIHPTVPLAHKGKGPLESSSAFEIPSFLHLNFPTSPNSEECVAHSVPTLVSSPDFISCKSEELSPRVPYLSSSDFPLREENKDSLLIFQNCWLWSLIIFLMQRSLLSAVFIPHEVFTPQKYVHSSTRGSAEGGYPLCGVRGVHPPGWGVWGQAGPSGGSGAKPPKQKLPYKSIL